jgi:Protein of unknown function (DUF3892)
LGLLLLSSNSNNLGGIAMADRHEIQCINKSERPNPHERITHVGGVSNGQRWKITQQEAIQRIEDGKWTFYVTRGGRTVDVQVVSGSRWHHKYLKTVADGEQPDNLLSLPECP